MNKLNEAFVSSMSTNKNTVKRFLELYLSLGRIKSAEEVCQTDIILPAMETILNEPSLRNCKNGLDGLYSQCYIFLQEDLKHLLQAAAEENNKYNFHFFFYIIIYFNYDLYVVLDSEHKNTLNITKNILNL